MDRSRLALFAFAGSAIFAKIERTAFRKSHRGIPSIKVLADFAFEHIARKGYCVASLMHRHSMRDCGGPNWDFAR